MKTRIVSFLLVALSLLQLSAATCFADDSFDYVWAYYDGVAQFEKDGKIGLLDEAGNILAPAEYDSIDARCVNNLRRVTKDGRVGMLDENGALWQGGLFHNLIWFSEENGLLVFQEEVGYRELAGLMDIHGKIIHPPKWDEFELQMEEINYTGQSLSDPSVFLFVHNIVGDRGRGLIDEQGQWVVPPTAYTWFSYDSNDRLRMSSGREGVAYYLYGVVDKTGIIVEPIWNELEMRGDFFLVCKKPKWGVLDASGTAIVEPVWDEVVMPPYYGDQLFMVCKDSKWGFINETGELISPLIWAEAREFYNGYAEVKSEDGKWGLLNINGELAIPTVWENIGYYANKRIAVEDDAGRWGVIDLMGNTVVDFAWDSIEPYFEGLALALKDGKYGFIHSNEEVALPLPYDHAEIQETIKGVLYCVTVDGSSGYADQNGNFVAAIDFKDEFDMRTWWSMALEGIYEWIPLVYTDKSKGVAFINLDGEVMLEGDWDKAFPFYQGYARAAIAVAEYDHRYGLIDKEGTVVIPIVYDWIDPYDDHLFYVRKDGVNGWIGPDFEIIAGIKDF